jgi:hypothetical protein
LYIIDGRICRVSPLHCGKHKTKVLSKLQMRKKNSLDKDPKLPDLPGYSD